MSFEYSVLTMSCDKFAPVWPAYYALLDRYWPGSAGKRYHYSESLDPERDGVTPLISGFDHSPYTWSEGLHYALGHIDTKYIILMLEDFFLDRKVKREGIDRCLALMRENPEVKCFRLVPTPGPDKPLGDDHGEVTPGRPYRISTQAAIWDAAFLAGIARAGESPWQFEHRGTDRSAEMPGRIWSVRTAPREHRIMSYHNAVIRGKMTRAAADFLQKEGIEWSDRIPVNSVLEEYYWFGAGTLVRRSLDFINRNVKTIMWRDTL